MTSGYAIVVLSILVNSEDIEQSASELKERVDMHETTEISIMEVQRFKDHPPQDNQNEVENKFTSAGYKGLEDLHDGRFALDESNNLVFNERN
jgi:hypothetical protein